MATSERRSDAATSQSTRCVVELGSISSERRSIRVVVSAGTTAARLIGGFYEVQGEGSAARGGCAHRGRDPGGMAFHDGQCRGSGIGTRLRWHDDQGRQLGHQVVVTPGAARRPGAHQALQRHQRDQGHQDPVHRLRGRSGESGNGPERGPTDGHRGAGVRLGRRRVGEQSGSRTSPNSMFHTSVGVSTTPTAATSRRPRCGVTASRDASSRRILRGSATS